MKTFAVLASILMLALSAFAQTEPPNKLVQFHLVIFKLGPKAALMKQSEKEPIRKQHWDHIWALTKSGKIAVNGMVLDGGEGGPLEIFILRESSTEQAKSWVESTPSVKAGLLRAEVHPWWSEDIFRKEVSAAKVETLYLGFLKRGPNRKAGDGNTPAVQELQKAHIANINRLAETRKLVVAGPFGGDGEYRGLFVFRVGSRQEAQELAATDPMIKIDRLRLELYRWWVQGGAIP